MSNWYGACRTNYVQVKDIQAVKDAFQPFPIEIHESADGLITLLSNDEYGGWPSSTEDADGNETPFDFELIVPFLEHGQVLIVMCAGAEKLRYITGDAHAYAWDGRHAKVSLDDIYDLAEKKFGVSVSMAEY